MGFSVQPRDGIFVKGYRFLSFSKNMGKDIGRNISKNLSAKYSQKRLDHTKKSVADALKTVSQTTIQKTAEPNGHLICKKLLIELQKFQKLHDRIVLKRSMIKKYLKKDIYFQRKDRKLLMV